MELDDGIIKKRPKASDACLAAISSSKIETMLNRVFGKRCEHVQGKSMIDVLGLFETIIYPLPTATDLDNIYKMLPPFVIGNRKSGAAEMSAYNFRMSEDWKVSFESMIHDVNFQITAPLVDELMLLVLKAGLSVLFYQQIPVSKTQSHLC